MFLSTILGYMRSGYSSTKGTDGLMTMNLSVEAGIWMIIAAILAVVGGILVYFLFVKNKENPKSKFLVALKNFLSFKTMWIEAIVKVMYYVVTIFVILASFAMIGQSFLAFILLLLLGPIVVRLCYEAAIMGIKIWRNTAKIVENMEKK